MKVFYSQELQAVTMAGITTVNKAQFHRIYAIARGKAMERRNIYSAFRGTGLIPYSLPKLLETAGVEPRPATPPDRPISSMPAATPQSIDQLNGTAGQWGQCANIGCQLGRQKVVKAAAKTWWPRN